MLKKSALLIISCLLSLGLTTLGEKIKQEEVYIHQAKFLFESCSEELQREFLDSYLPLLLKVNTRKNDCNKKCGEWAALPQYGACLDKAYYRLSLFKQNHPAKACLFELLAQWLSGEIPLNLNKDKKEQVAQCLKEYLLKKVQDFQIRNVGTGEAIKELYGNGTINSSNQG